METIKITERAIWAILTGQEPPIGFVNKPKPIEITSMNDGRTLTTLHPKYWTSGMSALNQGNSAQLGQCQQLSEIGCAEGAGPAPLEIKG